jgi:hypothetical protein
MNYKGRVLARNLDRPYGKFGIRGTVACSFTTKMCNNMFKKIHTVHIFRSDRSDQNAW